MTTFMAVANFIFGLKNTRRFFEEKNPVYLFAGLMFSAASGIYFYLAEKSGELEIRFGPDPEFLDED